MTIAIAVRGTGVVPVASAQNATNANMMRAAKGEIQLKLADNSPSLVRALIPSVR
jgi:hypothetical protein